MPPGERAKREKQETTTFTKIALCVGALLLLGALLAHIFGQPQLINPLIGAAIVLAIVDMVYRIKSRSSRPGAASTVSPDSTNTNIKSQQDLKKCPNCAEIIKAEAIKCKYCGSDLTQVTTSSPAAHPH